jgi:uncharacterized Fe-S cluster-containing radical SAM superfamily protein
MARTESVAGRPRGQGPGAAAEPPACSKRCACVTLARKGMPMLPVSDLIEVARRRVAGSELRSRAPSRFGDRGERAPVVVWNVCMHCNMTCPHCYAAAVARPSPTDLDTDEALALIDDLAGCGVRVVIFSGGEPLLRRDLFELLVRARERGIAAQLSTNGVRIDAAVAERLASVGVAYVGVSIDGLAAFNDAYRGLPGGFEAALRGLHCAKRAGMRTGLRMTLTRRNVAQLPAMAEAPTASTSPTCSTRGAAFTSPRTTSPGPRRGPPWSRCSSGPNRCSSPASRCASSPDRTTPTASSCCDGSGNATARRPRSASAGCCGSGAGTRRANGSSTSTRGAAFTRISSGAPPSWATSAGSPSRRSWSTPCGSSCGGASITSPVAAACAPTGASAAARTGSGPSPGSGTRGRRIPPA